MRDVFVKYNIIDRKINNVLLIAGSSTSFTSIIRPDYCKAMCLSTHGLDSIVHMVCLNIELVSGPKSEVESKQDISMWINMI